MGNSNISLTAVYNALAAKGVFDPRRSAGGYGDALALQLATQVLADIVSERYNWKWNSAVATPFYTNSWQQDYPQPAQAQGLIGWGETATWTDINNTALPKPLGTLSWRRQLLPVSLSANYMSAVCWMYNKDLQLGAWPGVDVTYYPLVTTGQQQANPIMSMLDKNGNILIVTGFGSTGSTAPFLPANSAEGATVTDGTVVWTCVSPTSQGFRVDSLPSQTGPTFQITPTYQIEPPAFTTPQQKLDPIPDSFSRYFYRGLESECLSASPDPADMKRGAAMKAEWMRALAEAMRQGDREINAFRLLPQNSPVESRWDRNIGPRTADNPL